MFVLAGLPQRGACPSWSCLTLPAVGTFLMLPHKFPDIGRMAATMSRHHARVLNVALVLSSRLDELVTAVSCQDWAEVQRASQKLAEDSRAGGYRVLSGMASRVAEEARRPHNELAIKRSLIRLIGTQSRVAPSGTP